MEWFGEWANKTLADLFDKAVERYPARDALVFGDRRMTYEELGSQVDSLAKGLVRIGINKGDKVGIWLSNRPEWLVSEFAIIKTGAVIVPLSSRLKAYDVGYILKQSESSTLIMMDEFLKLNYIQVIQEVIPELSHAKPGRLNSAEFPEFPNLKNIICLSDKEYPGMYTLKEITGATAEAGLECALRDRQASLNPRDVVNIPYTSGTTGFPKGVLTTHRQYIGETLVFKERLQIKEEDRFLAPAPFFANFGNYFGILLPMLVGGCTVPLESFDPEQCLYLIEKVSKRKDAPISRELPLCISTS